MDQNQIPELRFENLIDQKMIKQIHDNNDINYYWSLDWSKKFYIKQAYEGFISVSMLHQNTIPILLPEIQFSYAVLNWKNIHISKKIKKMINTEKLKSCYLKITDNPNNCYNGICNKFKDKNWLSERYLDLLQEVNSYQQDTNFKLLCTELWYKDKIVAGEIGYSIGSIYTSLTGFIDQDKKQFNNMGKVQLLCLAQLLISSEYTFWNLGHPQLEYKIDLGAIEVNRSNFLKMWTKHRDLKSTVKTETMLNTRFDCNQLISRLWQSL